MNILWPQKLPRAARDSPPRNILLRVKEVQKGNTAPLG